MIAARIVPVRAGKPKGEEFYKPSIEYTGKGNLLCYDAYGGRWFRSSREAVEDAVKSFVREYYDGTAVCYNDFYSWLGIAQTDFGCQYGWSPSRMYEIKMKFHLTYLSKDELKHGYHNTNTDIQFAGCDEGILIIRPDVNSLPFESYWEV